MLPRRRFVQKVGEPGESDPNPRRPGAPGGPNPRLTGSPRHLVGVDHLRMSKSGRGWATPRNARRTSETAWYNVVQSQIAESRDRYSPLRVARDSFSGSVAGHGMRHCPAHLFMTTPFIRAHAPQKSRRRSAISQTTIRGALAVTDVRSRSHGLAPRLIVSPGSENAGPPRGTHGEQVKQRGTTWYRIIVRSRMLAPSGSRQGVTGASAAVARDRGNGSHHASSR